MALKVIWYKRAKVKFDQIVNYLEREWGENSAKSFTRKTNNIINSLTKLPALGSMELSNRGIRGILIVRQVRLFYKVDKKQIKIIQLFDTRQHPSRRPK